MTRSLTPPQRSDTAHIFRHILLLLAAIGSVGTFVELILMGHYETPTQWPPLILLLLSLAGIVVVWVKPTTRALRLFRWLMLVVTLSSLVGVYFHMQSNFASVLERTPDLSWTAQLWQALQGRNPLLAPGVMAQVGLLSLAATFRHPSLSKVTANQVTSTFQRTS